MDLNEQIDDALKTLEALYYLTQGLAGAGGARISRTRLALPALSRMERQRALAALKDDIAAVRRRYGSLASNHLYKQILDEGRSAPTGFGRRSKCSDRNGLHKQIAH
jgi:hypothetical protein